MQKLKKPTVGIEKISRLLIHHVYIVYTNSKSYANEVPNPAPNNETLAHTPRPEWVSEERKSGTSAVKKKVYTNQQQIKCKQINSEIIYMWIW